MGGVASTPPPPLPPFAVGVPLGFADTPPEFCRTLLFPTPPSSLEIAGLEKEEPQKESVPPHVELNEDALFEIGVEVLVCGGDFLLSCFDFCDGFAGSCLEVVGDWSGGDCVGEVCAGRGVVCADEGVAEEEEVVDRSVQ